MEKQEVSCPFCRNEIPKIEGSYDEIGELNCSCGARYFVCDTDEITETLMGIYDLSVGDEFPAGVRYRIQDGYDWLSDGESSPQEESEEVVLLFILEDSKSD